MSKKNKKKVKRKLSIKKIIIFVIILFLIIFLIKLFNTNITNIYISGNTYLTDQEIIDITGLDNYPKSINKLSYNVEKKLKDNIYINNVIVTKNLMLNEIYIQIEENYPLFYYEPKEKTILYNGDEIKEILSSITVINSIPSEFFDELLNKLRKIDIDILNRISELEYKPNDLLKERFFLLMNDGNHVYITLDKFLTLNKYLDIIKEFDNKKGILYLDSGEYFDVFDS